MPILYAACVNNRKAVVFEGTYLPKYATSYKIHVERVANQFQAYRTAECTLADNLSMFYRNHDTFSLVVVGSKEIDLRESGMFFDSMMECISNDLSRSNPTPGKDINRESTDLEEGDHVGPLVNRPNARELMSV